jgi:hypothetical protein
MTTMITELVCVILLLGEPNADYERPAVFPFRLAAAFRSSKSVVARGW